MKDRQGRIRIASATVDFKASISSAMASAGVLHPRVFLGRLVIPPFSVGCGRRIHAAIFSFMAGVMPPMPRCPAKVEVAVNLAS